MPGSTTPRSVSPSLSAGRLVQTFTLAEGETYRFAVESVVDAEELGEMLGINVAHAQFLLYFKPAGQEGGRQP